ncbi:MAG: hypothetical protein L0154_14870 [Chloroflexi bacterium]|nr:hypothetical protein [Chloroflexota bacterium]
MNVMQIGLGQVTEADGVTTCHLPAHVNQAYHNAQIDDYTGLRRRDFKWTPPLKMTVRAHASHEHLAGTAGFGFWNQPFMPGSNRLPRLPRAVWFFFASPPSNMALVAGVPGSGWKCATFDAQNALFFALAPFAPLGLLLMRIPAVYRKMWPTLGQRALKVSEHALDVNLTQSHAYSLIWRKDSVDFSIDDEPVHHSAYSPSGPLGFVAWLDNQYAIVTPQGRFGFGFVERKEPQQLVLERIEIEKLT